MHHPTTYPFDCGLWTMRWPPIFANGCWVWRISTELSFHLFTKFVPRLFSSKAGRWGHSVTIFDKNWSSGTQTNNPFAHVPASLKWFSIDNVTPHIFPVWQVRQARRLFFKQIWMMNWLRRKSNFWHTILWNLKNSTTVEITIQPDAVLASYVDSGVWNFFASRILYFNMDGGNDSPQMFFFFMSCHLSSGLFSINFDVTLPCTMAWITDENFLGHRDFSTVCPTQQSSVEKYSTFSPRMDKDYLFMGVRFPKRTFYPNLHDSGKRLGL